MNYLTESMYSYFDTSPYFKAGKVFPWEAKGELFRMYSYFWGKEVSEEEVDRIAREGIEVDLDEAGMEMVKSLERPERISNMLCNFYWMVWGIWMSTPTSQLNYIEFARSKADNYLKAKQGT